MADNNLFLATLVEMGFDEKISKVALDKTGSSSVQSAMDWIIENPDFTPETKNTSDETEVPSSNQEGTAPIGGDQNIPVEAAVEKTPEEKAAAAAALQERLNKAREARIEKEKQEKLEKEKQRRIQGQEATSAKDTYEHMMMKKIADERKKEKAEQAKARARVKQQIAEDKERRRLENETAKNATSAAAVAQTSEVTQEIQAAKVARPAPTNTRLQIRFPDGSKRIQVFEADDSLKIVLEFAQRNGGFESITDFSLVFNARPPKKFTDSDAEKTLEELNLCPSAVLMVQKSS